ncbi:MAG: radical SAM protein, partial [Candidatus Neomarinimicrobiota bacterium]|nr:radical SAM protein [Candidatus Neomarinimicrobiota bacterium]
NICNYIHLPLQAGSDRILKRMNRTYDQKGFLDLVDKIKYYLPQCSISTDIIVGFPGETDAEFQETLNVMRQVNFNHAFMFKYSSRPGTKAAEYSDQITEKTKQLRLEEVISLQKKTTLNMNEKLINKTLPILIEKVSKKSSSQWAGRTEGNAWVVFDKNNEKIKDIVDVEIVDAKGVTLFGNRVLNKDCAYEVN